MGTVRRTYAAALLALVAVAGLAAGSAVRRDGNMFLVETQHYAVRCDISPEATAEIAQTMESVGAAYYRILKGFGGGRFGRLDVTVYRDRRDYEQVVGPAGANTSGIYRGDTRTTYACPGGIDVGKVTDVLRHEGFHQFADHYLGGNLPVWLNEGLAEYFRYGRLRKGKFITGELASGPLYSVQNAIRAQAMVPLGRLVTWSLAEWNETRRTDPEAGGLAYSGAYLFTFFLMEADNQRYRPMVGRYLARVNKGVDGIRAFKQVFGTDVNAIDAKWQAYVMAATPSTRHLCRARLAVIGDRLLKYGGGRRYTVSSFMDALDRGRMGPAIDVATLMHCPDDGRNERLPSYRFDYPDEQSALPRVICTHHKDFILVLTFELDTLTQQWEAIVREVER